MDSNSTSTSMSQKTSYFYIILLSLLLICFFILMIYYIVINSYIIGTKSTYLWLIIFFATIIQNIVIFQPLIIWFRWVFINYEICNEIRIMNYI